MKFKNKLLLFVLFLLFIFPINVLAYSKYIIPGGETIGIEVSSDGILVVGYYKVNNKYIGRDAGFEIGDKIIGVNSKKINNISELIDYINNIRENEVNVDIVRDNDEKKLKLLLEKDTDGIIKTGLYVKDSITGIGTLTYIDPESKSFGALGHEIMEKTTGKKFDIDGGIIFGADVVGIEKSNEGRAGEKNARYDKSKILGTINDNQISGIFGKYQEDTSNMEQLEIADIKDITTGKAFIRTVIENNKKEDFEIEIIRIDGANDTKNILFKITDERLLSKTGGIIQGMSGSPIIQNNKLIGAVTHVIVNDPTKGFGILITTMLKEGDS